MLAVHTLLSSLCVLGRRSVETAGPVELGLVGGHRVGDGHIPFRDHHSLWHLFLYIAVSLGIQALRAVSVYTRATI